MSTPSSAHQNWQKITNPTKAQLEANFKEYPVEYAHAVTWGWDGPVSRESIIKDRDAILGQGLRVVTIEAGYKMVNPYLSSGWFETVKVAVEEAKKRNMRVWIIDEGKYTSGFAGGKFSSEKPELRMQGIVVARRIALSGGQEIKGNLPADIIGAAAVKVTCCLATMRGLEQSPIDGVKFKNCEITAQRGFSMEHARNVDLSGLKIKGVSGEPIIKNNVQ